MASRPSDIIRMDLMTLQATDNSYSFDCVAPKEYNIALVTMFENAGMDLSTVLALGNWTKSNDEQEQVRDIIVYDIPYIWDVEKILGEKLSLKRQHKYQTLQVKIVLNSFTTLPQFNKFWMIDLAGIPVRWFPASWTLQERKQREKFQAVIHDIPEEMMMATFLTACGASAFKIIQTSKGKRKLVGYFENWEATLKALGTPQKALTKQKAKNVPDKKPGKSVQQSGNVNLKKKDQKSSTSAKKQAKSTKDSLKDPKSQKLKSNKKSSDKGDLVVIRIIDFISE
ncbi:hypothetical protein RhiirA1_473370 [Rhizophagus irregularis]|uniref:Uncharacterized protein n=1 Tax=Rhizophagus irregularis TaxID=588596 RepID=A0A2N0R0P8_9GLOM|nr:hypothetical protein RhiirA1_473370 [Rhizophagus irregularis]